MAMSCEVCTHCGGCEAGDANGKKVSGECFKCHALLQSSDLVCPYCGAPNLHYESPMKGFGLKGTSAWK